MINLLPSRLRRPFGIVSGLIISILLAAPSLRRGFEHALGDPAQLHPRIGPGPSRQDRLGHHHHHHRPVAGFRRHFRRLRKLVQIVFGLSIAFAASSFFLSFFSFGGGALV